MSDWATTANMDTTFEPLTQRSELVPEGSLPDDSVQAEVAAAAAESYHAAGIRVQRLRKKLTKKQTKLTNHVRPQGVTSKDDAVKRQLKASVASLRERLHTAVLTANAAKKAMNEAEASFGIRFATIPANLPTFQLPKDRGSITPKAVSDFLSKLAGVLNTHQFPKVQYGSNRWSKLLAIVFTNTTVEERLAISALGAQPWGQARASVIDQLANQSGKGEMCCQFVSMRQKTGESVAGFTKRFNEMWQRVEKDIVAYLYLNSLQEDVRAKVLQDSTFEEYESNIAELERRAIRAHASLRRARNFSGSNNTATPGDPGNSRDKRFAGKGSSENKGGVTSDSTDPISAATSTDAAEYDKAQEGGASPRKNYNDSETSTTRTHSGKRSYQQTSGGEEQWLDELLTLPDYKRPKKSKLRNDPNHSDHGDHSDRNDGSEHSEHSESGKSGDSASSV
jgi:hypothetical protein